MAFGRCRTCDKDLTGKQRYYCSDKCRQTHDRLTVKYPELTGHKPVSGLIDRRKTAFDRETNAIVVIMVIGYNSHNKTHESDGYAVKSLFGREIQRMALQELKSLFYDWEFTIKSIDVQKR